MADERSKFERINADFSLYKALLQDALCLLEVRKVGLQATVITPDNQSRYYLNLVNVVKSLQYDTE